MGEFILQKITSEYEEYLYDESRMEGKAVSISFPESENEIIDTLRCLKKDNTKVTVQGARTGITAGAVPREGHILNLKKMDRITGLRYDPDNGSFFIKVQPGALLTDICKAVSKKDFDVSGWLEPSIKALEDFKNAGCCFFPPDPTEATASIGGMAACNASGARSYLYGPTRDYVEALRIILSDGSVISIKRGEYNARGYNFTLTADTGRVINGVLPVYRMPDVKNASGYYVRKDMDLIDLFIGSEGTLGIISEIEIRLIAKPAFTWGGMFFFTKEAYGIAFVKALREAGFIGPSDTEGFKPAAIEYFNGDSLELLRAQKEKSSAFSNIPDIKKNYMSAIYTEFDGNTEEDVIESMLEASRRAGLCNGNESDTWIASTAQLMEILKLFRHAVPEAVNLLISSRRKMHPDITKLGTDMAVPDDRLEETLDMYRSDLMESGFESVMFGHIGNNHIHVNILPRTMTEYVKGKELYGKWADQVCKKGGTVSAEHGIGKLKVRFLEIMYGRKGIQGMKVLKYAFDPENILNTGNLFGND